MKNSKKDIFKKIIKELKKYNYNGTITLEIFAGGKKGVLRSKKKLERLLDGI